MEDVVVLVRAHAGTFLRRTVAGASRLVARIRLNFPCGLWLAHTSSLFPWRFSKAPSPFLEEAIMRWCPRFMQEHRQVARGVEGKKSESGRGGDMERRTACCADKKLHGTVRDVYDQTARGEDLRPKSRANTPIHVHHHMNPSVISVSQKI